MTPRASIIALLVVATASPLAASQSRNTWKTAPAGTAETRYCMRLAAFTGSRIEPVRCWTRAQWAEQDIDVDKDWPKEGIRTIG